MTVPTSRWSAAASPPAAAPCLACRPAASAAELAAHFRIRHQVFVMEQGLFRNGSGGPGHDHDPHDDDPATIHVIGLADGAIGGTVRLYPLGGGEGRWKGDRLAVLPEYRRHGLGAPLVRLAVTEAGARGGREMEAYIQPENVAFFEWLGWRRVGRVVLYAGINHQRMVTRLTARRQPGQSY